MLKIHDSGYKKLFRNKSIFRELIETFVDVDLVKELDLDNCEVFDKSFIEHERVFSNDISFSASFDRC